MRFNKPKGYQPQAVVLKGNRLSIKNAKLTAEQVVEARKLVRGGESIKDVAQRHQCDYTTLGSAVRGASWRQLNAIEPPVQTNRKWADWELKQVFDLYARGYTAREIAVRYCATATQITHILMNKDWTPKGIDRDEMPSRRYSVQQNLRDRALETHQVIEARYQYHGQDVAINELARHFGVSGRAMHNCVKGRTYKELPMPKGATKVDPVFYRDREKFFQQFNSQQIAQIRKMYDEGLSGPTELGRIYGCSVCTIYNIVKGKKKPTVD